MHDPTHTHQEPTPEPDPSAMEVSALVSTTSTCASTDPGLDPFDDEDEFPTSLEMLRA